MKSFILFMYFFIGLLLLSLPRRHKITRKYLAISKSKEVFLSKEEDPEK